MNISINDIFTITRNKYFKKCTHFFIIGIFTYFFVGNIVLYHKLSNYSIPRFVISNLSNQFRTAEYMHLLFTIQEINKHQYLKELLKEYSLQPYDHKCPHKLRIAFLNYNWAPEAYFIRIKKVLLMYASYEQTLRINETIEIMETQIKETKDSGFSYNQIELLKNERQEIINNELSFEEFEFMQNNFGLIQKTFEL